MCHYNIQILNNWNNVTFEIIINWLQLASSERSVQKTQGWCMHVSTQLIAISWVLTAGKLWDTCQLSWLQLVAVLNANVITCSLCSTWGKSTTWLFYVRGQPLYIRVGGSIGLLESIQHLISIIHYKGSSPHMLTLCCKSHF